MGRMNPLESWFVSGPIQGAYLRWVCYPRVFAWVDSNFEGRVLEVGCGPGKTTRELRRRLPRAVLVAVDVDQRLLEKARKAAPGVDFRVGDATKLDLPDGSFDAVFEFNAFHHLDYPRALREISRILRPGCSLFAADVCWSVGGGGNPPLTRDTLRRAMADAGLEVRAFVGRRLIAVHGVKMDGPEKA